MSRYKRGTKKPPVIVKVAEEQKPKEKERPMPPGLVRTYHPRHGWIVREDDSK